MDGDYRAERSILHLTKAILELKLAIDALAVAAQLGSPGSDLIGAQHPGSNHLEKAMSEVKIVLKELEGGPV